MTPYSLSFIGVGKDNVFVLVPPADESVAYLHASIRLFGYSIIVHSLTVRTVTKAEFSERFFAVEMWTITGKSKRKLKKEKR